MTHTMTFATKRIVEIHGNPVGKTFTFEVKRDDGIVYTYSGVTCVVDGDETHFDFDSAALLTTRKADR